MTQFNLPSASAVHAFTVSGFGGVDFQSAPHQVDKHRSPSCVNMIRDKNGSLRKRMGYEKIFSAPSDASINGACSFGNKQYVHSGDKLYSIDEQGAHTLLKSSLPDKKSLFIKWKDLVYVITGEGIYTISEKNGCKPLTDGAYIPTVIISKAPSGGGELHEDYNLLSPCWREQFLADGESTVYRLEKKGIDGIVSVKIRNENGDFITLETDKYTVSLQEGTVTFDSPPEKPLVVGMDNVIIEALKNEGNDEMLFGCTVGTVYGANGKNDRLFLGGNPNHVGMDFFSESGDFSYFPHMNYSSLSKYQTVGYSVSNGSLYTHVSPDGKGQSNIIKRNGSETEDGRDVFVITDEFSAPPLVSPHTTLNLNGESLFLSKSGVYGITVSDVTDERGCELRSAYLGKTFEGFTEEELAQATGIVFGDFYCLFVGGKAFIIDGAKKSYFSATPLCSFQYECYYWENIPSLTSWTDGKRVYFGSALGGIYAFFTDKTAGGSYTDDGEAVVCYFDTSEINSLFFKKKTYVSVSAKIGAFLNTGVRIYAKTEGRFHEKPVYDSMGRGRYFDFSYVSFHSISFSSNRSEVTLCGKTRIRNVDSVSFRLINDKAEPFALYAFGTEYVQKGNYIR